FKLGKAVGEQQAKLQTTVGVEAVVGQQSVDAAGKPGGVAHAVLDVTLGQAPAQGRVAVEVVEQRWAVSVQMPIEQQVKLATLGVGEGKLLGQVNDALGFGRLGRRGAIFPRNISVNNMLLA